MAARVMFDPSKALADVRLREGLLAAVRKRVPSHEVEEIVQATLTEALASASRPEDEESMRRWVYGIARNKVVDFHRRRSREHGPEDAAAIADATPAESAPHDAIDLLRWAEREMPEADNSARTLEWMLREGAGEKLEEIARDEAVPAPAVRQRVARMRKHFRTRWAALAAAALVTGAIAFFWFHARSPVQDPQIAKSTIEPVAPDPIAKGKVLRREALDGACNDHLWDACIEKLDEAAKLDPEGDLAVQGVRKAAADANAPPPAPSPSPSPAPSPAPVIKPPAKPAPKPAPIFDGNGNGKKSKSKSMK